MNYNLRNLGRAGFKFTGLFSSPNSFGLFYRVRGNRVEYASSYWPPTLGYFELDAKEMKAFKEGKISLCPPGFCNPSGGNTLTNATILSTEPVRNLKALEKVFSTKKT